VSVDAIAAHVLVVCHFETSKVANITQSELEANLSSYRSDSFNLSSSMMQD
jgi:hypothetical protein